MALDHELPVWSVAPNWQQSVLETLEWRTEVLTSLSGAEQRIAVRETPRRMIEARYNPHERERTFVDLALHRLGRSEWMMPLWFDSSTLTAPAVLAGTRIDCATAYHEFSDGGMAYLAGPDAFTGEAVRIDTVDETGFSLAAPLGSAWPTGTRVYPMRRGRFDPPSQSLIVSRLSEITLRFVSVEGNALADEGSWALSHSGLPVMDRTPEWSERQEIDLDFLGESFDPGLGRLRLLDTAGRSFRSQQLASILHGAREQFEFRQMLYRLRGQQNAIWLPTYADDLAISSEAVAGVTEIDVDQVGLVYVGGPTDGRDHLLMPDGQIVEIDAAALPAPGTERLTLAAATTGPLMAGQRLSFVEKVRLAQDSVEIEHIGDVEGSARSVLSFKAFSDRRTSTSAVQTHPAATMNNDQCGEPAAGVCSVWEPPFQLPVGVYFAVTLSMPGNTREPDGGSLIIDLEGHGGNSSYSYGSTAFPDTNADRQYAVSSDWETVICYFTRDIPAPSELYLQMQRLGGPTSNSISFNGNGPLTTRTSQVFDPGEESDGGNGLTSFPGTTNSFPQRRYFGV